MSSNHVFSKTIFELALPPFLDRQGVNEIETQLAVRLRRLDDPRRGLVAQRVLVDESDRLLTLRVRKTDDARFIVDVVDSRPDLAPHRALFTAIEAVTSVAASLSARRASPTDHVPSRPAWGIRSFLRHEPALIRSVQQSDVISDLLPGRVGDGLSSSTFVRLKSAFLDDMESGHYAPTPMTAIEHPKPRGGTRPAAALRYTDRLVFAALVDRCRGPINEALRSPDEVLWPRGSTSPKRWRDLETFVHRTKAPYILTVDVRSFYDSINHELLSEQLARVGCATAARPLTEFLSAVMGRAVGLPQGLAPSDPLATMLLTPLDDALASADLTFVRHGDDMRIAVKSLEEARAVEHLVKQELRNLELPVNEEKTRTLHRGTYLSERTAVSDAVKQYVESDGSARNSAIHRLLTALGADEDLQWSWYHGNLRIDELLADIGGSIQPGDEDALLILLDEVAGEQLRMEAWRQGRRTGGALGHSTDSAAASFLMQASVGLLAAAKNESASTRIPATVIARPEYADALDAYVGQLAVANPVTTAQLLQSLERTGVPYDTQWLRLYQAIGRAGSSGEFDSLAASHMSDFKREMILRLRAASFLASFERAPREDVNVLVSESPEALRDDALHLVVSAEPQRAASLLASENELTRALVTAAA
jgi:hypothetical protein